MKKIAIFLLMAAVISLSACTVSPETEVPASTKVTTISDVTAETTAVTTEASSIGTAETQIEAVTSADVAASSEKQSVATTANTSISEAETTTQTSGGKVNNEKMYVHFIDVGQGDSIFIELPNGESMLIDAAEEEQADKIITYIHQQGYDSLDYVVETHPHSDHMGGMADVINNFNVSNVYLSPATNTTAATTTAAVTTAGNDYKYVLNTKTKKIHYANCSSVDDMNEENKAFTNDYDKAIADGYVPCKRCYPVG